MATKQRRYEVSEARDGYWAVLDAARVAFVFMSKDKAKAEAEAERLERSK